MGKNAPPPPEASVSGAVATYRLPVAAPTTQKEELSELEPHPRHLGVVKEW